MLVRRLKNHLPALHEYDEWDGSTTGTVHPCCSIRCLARALADRVLEARGRDRFLMAYWTPRTTLASGSACGVCDLSLDDLGEGAWTATDVVLMAAVNELITMSDEPGSLYSAFGAGQPVTVGELRGFLEERTNPDEGP